MKIVRLQFLLLTALLAVTAIVPAVTAAAKVTKVFAVQTTGFIENQAVTEQVIRLGETAEVACAEATFKSPKEYTLGEYTKVLVHPEYSKCVTTVGGIKTPAKFVTAGCAFETSSPVGEFNLWKITVGLVSFEKVGCTFEVKGGCEIKMPVELNKALSTVSIKNVTEIQDPKMSKNDKMAVLQEISNVAATISGCGETIKTTAGKYSGEEELKRVIVNTK